MSLKTIFIIAVTVLVTVVLMNNTDEVSFWLFGETRISKLAILAVFFLTGFLLGLIAGRPRKKTAVTPSPVSEDENNQSGLSQEDRDYIS